MLKVFKISKVIIFLCLLISLIIALMFSPSEVFAQTILFEDNFNDGDASGWDIIGNTGWNVLSGEYGIFLNPGLSNSIPSNSRWDFNWKNIIFNVDLRGVSGTDKNILLKFKNPSNFVEIHHTGGTIYLAKAFSSGGGVIIDSAFYPLSNGVTYHFTIEIKNGNQFKIFINNDLVLEGIEPSPIIDMWKVGLRAGTGAVSPTEVWFDNVIVEELETNLLNVPDIKQAEIPWGPQEYDTASKWSSNPTIIRWGCALTSATMILNYHGYSVHPDALNNWLKSQPDGYTRNGGVMWTAISRFTRLNSSTPTLEFSYHSPDINFLASEIDSGRPGILKYQNPTTKATHFVVAKGKTNGDFFVNDPSSSSNTLASQVASQRGPLVKIGRISPTLTDLSYIVLIVDEDFNLKVIDPDGNEITEGYLTEGPIVDAVNNTDSNGVILNTFYLPKPEIGFYEVEVSGGTGDYHLDSYIYDREGQVNISEFEANLGNEESNVFLINLDKENSQNSNISEVSFNSLLRDLNDGYKKGEIKRRGVYRILRRIIVSAKRYYARGRTNVARRVLLLAHRPITLFTPRFIESDTATYLQTKIKILHDSL